MKRSSLVLAAGLLSIAGAVAMTPQTAEACGGTFCDAGPQPMPVDQSGENILFVRDGEFIEAHIQIQYEGDAEQFGWVIPLQGVPEFSVGSEPLFQALLAGTVPTYFVQTQPDDCNVDQGNGFPEDGAGGDDGAGETGSATGGDPGGPQVVLQQTVGAYEITVLSGGTAAEVITWLDDNGYAQDDDAGPILQEYLDDGFMFVAFKLQSGAGLDEIHPVVVRYEGDEPCVPLRLTRIAAKEDMSVRVFFLGQSRVVPQNYRHVELNPLKLDWIGLGSNYEQVVTLAVDGEGADGHGFVTEYAGPTSVVDPSGIYSPQWSSQAFLDFDPDDLSDMLRDQGLLACSEFDPSQCEFAHPLIVGMLETYFPAPPGEDPEDFYKCTRCYLDDYDFGQWDMGGFAIAFEERIVGPAELAMDRLKNPYLTRMYTTISPGEMTSDPLFHENPDLPDVSNQWSATRVIDCEGPDRLELPGGQEIYADENDQFPDFDEMSYAQRVEEIAPAGGPIVLVDHAEDIDAELGGWNTTQASRAAGCDCRATRRSFSGSGPLMLMFLLGLRARSRRRTRR